jgi:hypothetical protein
VEFSTLFWHNLQKASLEIPALGQNIGLLPGTKLAELSVLDEEARHYLFHRLSTTILKSYDGNWLILINKKKENEQRKLSTFKVANKHKRVSKHDANFL